VLHWERPGDEHLFFVQDSGAVYEYRVAPARGGAPGRGRA
jgi:hypothetical protein